MNKTLGAIIVTTILVLLCMFYPFMPGEFDNAASSISIVAQIFCFASLLFVPIGIFWLSWEFFRARSKHNRLSNGNYYFAASSIFVFILISLVVSITLWVSNNRVMAGFSIAFLAFFSLAQLRNLKRLRNLGSNDFRAMGVYLVLFPLTLLSIRTLFLQDAVKYSRQRAIVYSQQMVKDIESYRDRNGYYPVSMLALHPDYKPAVIGVKQFHYEQKGNAYNLYFEQLSTDLGTIEIVMYNPLGEHQMTSHAQDLLTLPEVELNRQRGYYEVRELSFPRWKVFLFD